ncbi:hypothetical protein [uncultured Pedobacter sp.]|uniref:hypothetical protein n=1 Tax=uncultured Pedobacter sp. TaxID=246139 RepID=UPI0025FE3D07|nr:hypothetical protein [uncultured Pedobacter sp.]
MLIGKEFSYAKGFPLYAAGHGSFSQLILFLAVFKNAAHFDAPKYPKRFVNPAMSLLRTADAHQKNSGTLFNQVYWFVSFV